MFRRFFPRKHQKQESGSQHSGQPSKAQLPDHLKAAAEALQKQAGQQDDGIHRMVLRAGEQAPPDDPAEQAYAHDQGEHTEIAQKALQAGDFARSIYHLGLALASDPAREESLTLLDQWIATVGEHALDFVPLNDKQYFATLQASQFLMNRNTPTHRMEVAPVVEKNYHARVALHASILAAQGKMQAAVDLLLQLVQFKPEIPYMLWLARWQKQPGFAEALNPEQVAAIATSLIQKYPGSYLFSEQDRADLQHYLPLLQATYTTCSHKPTSDTFLSIASMYAMALRKAGAFEEAARVARALPATSYQTLVALAMAEEALGNLPASIAAYQQALTLLPDDVAVRNDLGTLFLHQGQLVEALALYEESIRLDAKDPYQMAAAYVAYLKHLQPSPSETWLKKLQTLAQSQRTAHKLLFLVHAPYIGTLPTPDEALINLLRDIKAKSATGEVTLEAGSTLGINLSTLEAPSAQLAMSRTLEAQGVSFTLNIEEVFSPDPRQPLHPVEYLLWRYEGMTPLPAVPPPDPVIAEKIAALAQTPYALECWHAPARVLGESLGPTALTSLLGVMVHPPATPAGWEVWDWIIAVQLASALTIAAIDTGWEGSRRKAALTSLIYGPMDWSGTAALIAMALLARQDKRINIELDHICRDLWHLGPSSAEWPLERAMVYSLIFAGDCSEEAQERAHLYFEQMRNEDEDSASS